MINKEKHSSQYIRTDKSIVQAFCQLLKTKNYENITIQDILDATPISRAAFYQHFEDKEAIAQQMMNTFLDMQQEIIKEMGKKGEANYIRIVEHYALVHRDFFQALQKIHTSNINLENTIASALKEQYLDDNKGVYCEMEASIYAKTLCEFQIYSMMSENGISPGDPMVYNTVMINIFLYLMKWSDRKEIRNYLMDHLPS